MTKFYCPENRCEHGDIIKCSNEASISDRATFTDEEKYPLCPYFKRKKESKQKQS